MPADKLEVLEKRIAAFRARLCEEETRAAQATELLRPHIRGFGKTRWVGARRGAVLRRVIAELEHEKHEIEYARREGAITVPCPLCGGDLTWALRYQIALAAADKLHGR